MLTCERGAGRHCEVIIKAHGIANPQWTRQQADAPEWMKLGFRIFVALSAYSWMYEVFPSASYNMLKNDQDVRIDISFANFSSGPKDMLDACISAVTVQEFLKGNGEEVGDVPVLMTELVAWLNEVQDIHPVLMSGIAQFQLVHIHPFVDGNGRTSRLLSTLCLYRVGYDFKRLFTISE